jgi:uncharacterized protein (TIGR01777 family)
MKQSPESADQMPPTRIVVAGGTGLLGRALSGGLAAGGHDVIVLTRHPSSVTVDPSSAATPHAGVRLAQWTPDGTAGPWAAFLDGAAAVVNLAGEPIAAGRWSWTQKVRLRESRFDATRSLLAGLAACTTPPSIFVSGSATGYYGTRGDERLTEDSPPGSDFLGDLCVEWETIARRAAAYSRRVVVVRTGLVLDREGGALPRMVAPFRFYVGGPIGSGSQYVSWIHIDDWVALVTWAIADPSVSGPINATAPNPVTNREFAREVGAVLHRPAWLPVPAIALRALLGEMADALLLGGQRVIPERTLALGFRFRHRELMPALQSVLRKT